MMASKTAPEETLITSKGAWTGSNLVFYSIRTITNIRILQFFRIYFRFVQLVLTSQLTIHNSNSKDSIQKISGMKIQYEIQANRRRIKILKSLSEFRHKEIIDFISIVTGS